MYIPVGHLPSILWSVETINIPLTFPRTSKNIQLFFSFIVITAHFVLATMNLELDISYQMSKCLVLNNLSIVYINK